MDPLHEFAYTLGQFLDKYPEEKLAIALSIASEINAFLKAHLRDKPLVINSNDHIALNIIGFLIMGIGNKKVFDTVFAGIDKSKLTLEAPPPPLLLLKNANQVGGGLLQNLMMFVALLMSLLAAGIVQNVGPGRPVAPTPAENVSAAIRGMSRAAVSGVLPEFVQRVELPDIQGWLRERGYLQETYPAALADGAVLSPDPKSTAAFEDARRDAIEADIATTGVLDTTRLAFTNYASGLLPCATGAARCTPAETASAQVYNALLNPSLHVRALQVIDENLQRELAAAAEGATNIAAVGAAQLVLGSSGNRPALPTATPTPAATEPEGKWSAALGRLSGSLEKYVPEVVKGAASSVKGAASSAAAVVAAKASNVRASAEEKARETLALAATRQATRTRVGEQLKVTGKYLSVLRGLSPGGILDAPPQFIAWCLSQMAGLPPPIPEIQPIVDSYPRVLSLLQAVNDAAQLKLENVGANGTTAIVSRTSAPTDPVQMLVAVDAAYTAAMRTHARVLALETHEVLRRQEQFRQDYQYFLTQLTSRLQADPQLSAEATRHLESVANGMRILGRAPSSKQVGDILNDVIRSLKTNTNMLTAVELLNRMDRYSQPQNVQLVRAFQRAMFLTFLLFGGIKGVEFLLFGLIGGTLALTLRAGSSVVTGLEIAVRGAVRTVGPSVVATGDLFATLIRAAQVSAQRRLIGPMPRPLELENAPPAAGQGGGRRRHRKTRRGKKHMGKARKSRRTRK